MRDQIRRLGADTAIYGVSTIVGRFLNFFLVFFYTNVLPPGEYGVVAYAYSLIAFLNILYGYGMESAYFKYASTGEYGDAKQIFSTPSFLLVGTSLVISCALTLWSNAAGRIAAIPDHHAVIVTYSAWILFCDTLAIIPFARLRLERKAVKFGMIKIVNIVVNLGANVFFLFVLRKGVEGIFLSGLVASALTIIMLLPDVVRNLSFTIPRGLLRALLAFGLPYVPAGLASMMVQVVDRPIMRMLTNDATVGIYQANYRLGIVMMLVVAMFDYAWRPFFLSHASEPDAKRLFARVLTYFVFGGTCVVLVFSLFVGDLVAVRVFGRYLIHPDYWSGLSIVPLVLLGYLFLGVYNNLIAGIYIEKRTSYLPGITMAGAVVNVGTNFLLIPFWGMMGAAFATVLAYAVMAGILYLVVQRIYPISYEWGRVGLIALSGAAVFAAFVVVHPPVPLFAWKVFLLVAFVGSLGIFGFFRPSETGLILSLLGVQRKKNTTTEKT